MIDNTVVVLNEIEHVLTVPSRYIGSITPTKRREYILTDKNNFEEREIIIVPAFITLLREVISNSVDEFIRTSGEYGNTIDISFDGEYFQVKDNGRGISHKSAIDKNGKEIGISQSIVAFTKTKTGANFKEKTTNIGQNGEGVSLVNIFSKHFIVDTSDGKKKTHIECFDNMKKIKSKFTRNNKKFTNIKWKPDYERLNVDVNSINREYENYIKKIILDMSMCYPGIKFKYNKKVITAKSFRDYIKRYGNDFEIFGYQNIDIAIFPSSDFEQVSWVNGIYTRRGGMHVDTVESYIKNSLRDILIKKYKDIKPLDIKNKLFFIINVRNMKAPRFDSQTKEELINNNEDFEADLFEGIDFETIAKKINKNKPIIDNIIETFKIKEELRRREKIEKKQKKLKSKSIPKLLETYERNRKDCRLYILEGESAIKNFLPCREKNYAAYPLKGKFINCKHVSKEKLLQNNEVKDLLSAINLKLTSKNIDTMRYGKIVIFTDADYDGDAICCLLINFFCKFWPKIVEEGRLYRAVTPLIIATNEKKKEKYYFSMTEFQKACETEDLKLKKYNKGLGSLSMKDYEFSLDNLTQIVLDDYYKTNLEKAFGKDTQRRKNWLLEK